MQNNYNYDLKAQTKAQEQMNAYAQWETQAVQQPAGPRNFVFPPVGHHEPLPRPPGSGAAQNVPPPFLGGMAIGVSQPHSQQPKRKQGDRGRDSAQRKPRKCKLCLLGGRTDEDAGHCKGRAARASGGCQYFCHALSCVGAKQCTCTSGNPIPNKEHSSTLAPASAPSSTPASARDTAAAPHPAVTPIRKRRRTTAARASNPGASSRQSARRTVSTPPN